MVLMLFFKICPSEIWKFGRNLLLAKFGRQGDQLQTSPCDINAF